MEFKKVGFLSAIIVCLGGIAVTFSNVNTTPDAETQELTQSTPVTKASTILGNEAASPRTASDGYQQYLVKQQASRVASAEEQERQKNERAKLARSADERNKVQVPRHLKPSKMSVNTIDNLSIEALAKTFGAQVVKKDKVTLLRRNNELFTEQQVRFLLKRLHSTSTNS